MALSPHSIDTLQTASTRSVERVTGTHLFKIMGYSLDNDISIGKFLESTIFTVAGYDWSIRYYPNGCNEVVTNFISIFLCLKSKADGVKAQLDFTLLDQTGMPLPISTSYKTHCFDSTNYSWGSPNFVERTKLESHLKDDCFIIKCTVAVILVRKVEPVAIVVPPINILQQFGNLLESGNGADVKFRVDEETLCAHKCILAARSSVFSAQFFGPMKEKTDTAIKIEDMEAPVFKAMLYFIYQDTCPEIEEVGENKEKVLMAQHLLVAADRYALERLKVICAKMLYDTIDASNVVTLLSFADRHNCIQLKTACLKFLALPEIFGQVLATEEFQNLVSSRPPVLKELSEK